LSYSFFACWELLEQLKKTGFCVVFRDLNQTPPLYFIFFSQKPPFNFLSSSSSSFLVHLHLSSLLSQDYISFFTQAPIFFFLNFIFLTCWQLWICNIFLCLLDCGHKPQICSVFFLWFLIEGLISGFCLFGTNF
jgi:hypothetical protein